MAATRLHEAPVGQHRRISGNGVWVEFHGVAQHPFSLWFIGFLAINVVESPVIKRRSRLPRQVKVPRKISRLPNRITGVAPRRAARSQ
jgi:hypothetical protein